jgi:hypothetical protein
VKTRRTLSAAVLAVLVAAVAAPLAGSAPARGASSIDLLRTFRTQLPKVKKETTVPVLLPHALPLGGRAPKLYADGGGDRRGWVLLLAGAPRCGGANACFVASFEASKGGKLPGTPNARLAGGDPALYVPIGCGASCSPASLFFVHRGVLYSWQVKDPPRGARAALLRLAAEAIAAGPR